MQIFLHKVVPIFFLPVSITLLLLLLGLMMRSKVLIWAGFGILWLSSMPLVSSLMVRSVEAWQDRGLAKTAEHANAIVVLSTGRLLAPGITGVSEWNDPDRYYGGIELYKAGKAPLLIFTGGLLSYKTNSSSEGQVLMKFANELGIPSNKMLTTITVVNTAEEAKATAKLFKLNQLPDNFEDEAKIFGKNKILLVTSAYHMPRAKRLFEQEGFNVIPFPVDFQVSQGELLSLNKLFPSAVALNQTEMMLREIYARLFYGAFFD